MTQILYCDLCGSAIESTIHVIRDCGFAKTIWKSIVPKRGWRDFFNSTLEVTVAGVMRGPSRGWLVGFRMITSMSDIFNIEFKAVLEGLKLAWDRGFRQVEVESDNSFLINVLRNDLAARDSNKVADQLAKMDRGRVNCLVIHEDPHHSVNCERFAGGGYSSINNG
ncbi:hypothetical protein Gotri_022110 [Gossypium trilobum]|uniref:RNase H type-1 domain-containing protein n=1 Tax=Gossypium trilobum TaxID=34281 RepID=A0A7J9DEJ3_9ROSI|nr:hypothetical protein [Gossypium trilobum]